MPTSAIIIGGGIAGCVAALTLSKLNVKCTIYELCTTPSTIGGAINVTPNAVHIFENFGVEINGCSVDAIELFSLQSGGKIGEMGFRGPSGPSKRVPRSIMHKELLKAVERAGVEIVHGAKLVRIEDEAEKNVVAVFEGGRRSEADFIVGCDGMYSAVRMNYVEPERKVIYTGVSTAYAIVEKESVKSEIHFKQTAVNVSRYGALMTSYTDSERTKIYLGAVMATEEQDSREGWRVQGLDREKTQKEIETRYTKSAFPCLPELIEKVEDWTFYPVCKLEPDGKWSKGRVILLGDAAHGMPPQGESTALAIEDAVLLARVFEELHDKSVSSVFAAYEKTRRPRIDTAYKDAVTRWGGSIKTKSWIQQKLEEQLTSVYMRAKGGDLEKNFAYDVRQETIVE